MSDSSNKSLIPEATSQQDSGTTQIPSNPVNSTNPVGGIANKKQTKEAAIRSWTEEKINLSNDWLDNVATQTGRNMVFGGIHKCHLGENIGTEQSEYRPVIIVSNNTINTTSGNVLVVPLTTTLKTKTNRNGKVIPKYRSNTFLYKNDYPFLSDDSAVLCQDAKAVSKVRLKEHLGTIDKPADLARLRKALSWTLGIE